MNDGAYAVHLDEYKPIGTHSMALYANSNNVKYFNKFGVQHIVKEIKRFISNNNIITTHMRICLFCLVQAGVFLFAHLLLSLLCWLR